MMNHPLIEDCVQATGLPRQQIEAAIGLALVKVREIVEPEDFDTVQTSIPQVPELLEYAPKTRKGFLGKLVGTLGSDQTAHLLELSQGLSKIGIPSSQHRQVARALMDSVERHYPELRPVFESLRT